MAEDHRALDDDVADAPGLVEVRVGAADADGLDLHEHLITAKGGNGHIPQLDRLRLGEDARGHVFGQGCRHGYLLYGVWWVRSGQISP